MLSETIFEPAQALQLQASSAPELTSLHPDAQLFHQDRFQVFQGSLLFPRDDEETVRFFQELRGDLGWLSKVDQTLFDDFELAVERKGMLGEKVKRLQTKQKRDSLKVRINEPEPGAKPRSLTQRMFPVERLPEVIQHCQGRQDHYVGQCSYRGWRNNGSVEQLTSCWVDLDYYKSSRLREILDDDGQAVEQILDICMTAGRGARWFLPSQIVRSGMGIYVKWIFNHYLPRAAKPRWQSCMRRLLEVFAALEADPAAKDPSRVLRVVGSVNSKNGRLVRVLYQGQSLGFNDLAGAVLLRDPLSPTDREAVKDLRASYKANADRWAAAAALKSKKTKRPRPVGSGWPAICAGSLELLATIRGSAGLHKKVEITCFTILNYQFLAGQIETREQFDSEIRRVGELTGADVPVLRARMENLWFRWEMRATPDMGPYIFKKKTLIDLLEITPAEQAQLPGFPGYPGRSAPAAKKRDTAAGIGRAALLHDAGMHIKQIAARLQVSERQVRRWLKSIPDPSAKPRLGPVSVGAADANRPEDPRPQGVEGGGEHLARGG